MSGLCIDRVRAEEGGRGGHRRHERTGHSRRARASGLGFCEPKGQRYVSPRTYAWPVMGLVKSSVLCLVLGWQATETAVAVVGVAGGAELSSSSCALATVH